MATPLPVFVAEVRTAAGLIDPLTMRTMAKGGDAILAAARQKVPVRTGSLKKSIRNHGPRLTTSGVAVKVTAGGPSAPIQRVDYATFVEQGTARMAPRPYMRPAVNQTMPQIVDEIADVMALLVAGRPGRAAGSIRSRVPGGPAETPARVTGVNPLVRV